jgi:uncharacterized membrane protein YeaQ/YmgE (transglycosylase-associated protein family)
MDDQIQLGIDAYNLNNKILAMQIFNGVIQSNPKNEQAWLWLVASQDTVEDKIDCLKKALANLPNSENIKYAIAKLEYRQKKLQSIPDNKIETSSSLHNNRTILRKILSVILNILLYAFIIFASLALLYILFLTIVVKTYDPSNFFSGWLSLFLGSGSIIAILVIGLRIAIGSWSARIMKNKRRSVGVGWIMGIFLGLLGVIIAACLSTDEKILMEEKLVTGETKICSACRMIIDTQASICPYCRTQQK